MICGRITFFLSQNTRYRIPDEGKKEGKHEDGHEHGGSSSSDSD